MEFRRIYVFLALFTFVYFLESIGGTYMISAIQNIERHFQIPSKLSGFLVSAHDISYCLLVIHISFYGSKGNRAKWIGVGTITMALAHIMTSSPNFLFPSNAPQLNTKQVEEQLRPSPLLAAASNFSQTQINDNNISPLSPPPTAPLSAFLEYAPIRDRMPPRLRQALLDIEEGNEGHPVETNALMRPNTFEYDANYTDQQNPYSMDEQLIAEIFTRSNLMLKAENGEERRKASADLVNTMRQFVSNRQQFPKADLETMRRAAVAPFAFCHNLVNQMRDMLQRIKCHRNSSNMSPLFIIFGAMLLLGVGRTMPWTLGVPLIDDNVRKAQMPIYFAMINFFKILGPIFGFLIGSVVNKLYYTFPNSAPRGLTPQDPTWIGAWWLGFLIIGIIMIGPSIALFFFPGSSEKKKNMQLNGANLKHLNGNGNAIHSSSINSAGADGHGHTNFHSLSTARIGGEEKAKKGMTNGNGKERMKLALVDRHLDKDASRSSFRAFLGSYKDILNSRVYVGASVARVIDVLAIKGYMVFLPKYLENHYGIPRYQVHIYMAFFGVMGFALGAASGGVITRKLRLNGRKAAIYVLIISMINTSLFALKSTLGCHSIVNRVGQVGQPTNFNYTQECNAQCGCDSAKLYPVCDGTGQIYYSPCHAGCRHVEVIDLNDYKLQFSECDCLSSAGSGIVSKELCHDNCAMMKYLFFGTIILGAFLAGTAMVPGMLILLRSVPPHTRSPALGLQGFLVSLIGTLPSPIIWGWLIDSACQIWDDDCNGQGACQVYDPWALRMRMHWLYVVIRLFSLIADIYVCVHAKGLNLQEEDQDEEESQPTHREGTVFTMDIIPASSDGPPDGNVF